jgi:hypothetical protein
MNQNEQEYFEWLISQVKIPNNRTYYDMFSRMYDLEFVWMIPNDDNRVQDGLDLRGEFSNGIRRRLNGKGVSILEILVSLSRRVSFIAGGDAPTWAWRLLKNLRLTKISDPLTDEKINKLDEILYNLVWRAYDSSGHGGFFPLKNPIEDQTKVELWYQMNAYVNEMYTY